jgi:hypothetical protein
MDVNGNEDSYKHPIYFTAQRKHIAITVPISKDSNKFSNKYATKYVNIRPVETFDTGGTYYGLFEIYISNSPTNPHLGKKYPKVIS